MSLKVFKVLLLMKKVDIYSTPTCVYCNMAKEFFNQNNIAYTDYNVATDLEKRQEMIEKSGQMGVPVIMIDNEIVVGFGQDRLVELLGISK
jgi:glutaredoxin-like YruB-family protein